MYIIHQTEKTVTIATDNSDNPKTGKGIQVWILDARQHPHQSRTSGDDADNQCKGCPLASYGGCYVGAFAIAGIYKAWQAGKYQPLEMGSKNWNKFFRGQYVRLGAYGNPSLLPITMIESISSLADRVTGYFHDWHLMAPERARSYGRFLMASCETKNWKDAQALGLRTFTTCTSESDVQGAGMQCLSDTHKTQCKDCGLCDGTARSNARAKPLPSAWIKVHGYQVKKATAATLA